MILMENVAQLFGVFLLVLARLAALTVTAPALLGTYVPVMFRVMLAVLLAILVTPVCCDPSTPLPENLIEFLAMLVRETILGLLVGVTLLILFSAMRVAGQIISQVSGLQLAEVFDPSLDGGLPVVSRLLELVALALFLTLNGHHQVLEAILTSFRSVPPGSASWTASFTEAMLEAIRQSFEVGLRAAAPVMISVLLAVLVVGLLGRTLPQLNILAVGFSLNALALLGVLFISAGSAAWLFQLHAEILIEQLRQAINDG